MHRATAALAPNEEAYALWSASAYNRDVQDLSHWRGCGRWDDETWHAHGQASLKRLHRLFREHRPPWAEKLMRARRLCQPMPMSLLEWGSGGGANVVAIAPVVERYFGIDISAPNLEEACRQAEAADCRHFRPVHLDASPRAAVDKVPVPIDIVISTAVFQHFPSKDYGIEVVRSMAQLLAPGGIGLIQMRYDDGRQAFAAKRGAYAADCINYTSYALYEFEALLQVAGLETLEIRVTDPKVNYAEFAFARPASG